MINGEIYMYSNCTIIGTSEYTTTDLQIINYVVPLSITALTCCFSNATRSFAPIADCITQGIGGALTQKPAL